VSAGKFQPARGKPVQVARRPAGRRRRIPPGIQQPAIGQTDQDRVHRPGLQARLQADVIAMPPSRRIGSKGSEHRDGLR
jgi:hypothetical protein